MPAYTIQRDPPWMPNRASTAPTASSVYSDDSDTPYHEFAAVPMMPAALTNSSGPRPQYSVSGFPHPKQQVMDPGPQVQRQSKMPIFKQVRGLLHKPLPPLVTTVKPAWDEFSGEPSDTGKPRLGQKPSTYTSPFQHAFRNRGAARQPSSDKLRTKISKRSLSPVSMLRDSEIYDDQDEEIRPVVPLKAGGRCISPVSPVSPADVKPPTPLSMNMRSQAVPEESPAAQAIKRKPVSKVILSNENVPPPSPPYESSYSPKSEANPGDSTPTAGPARDPVSHFSWTTYAASQAPGRPSTDTCATRPTSGQVAEMEQQPNKSRFSWTTINTTVTSPSQMGGPLSPSLPAEPMPQIPPQYKISEAPMQSILSRKRPVGRSDRDDWSPSPRSATPRSATSVKPPTRMGTPNAVTGSIRPSPISTAHQRSATGTSSPPSSGKALPLPPELQQPSSPGAAPLSHFENLQAQEKDLVLQRRNIEKAIADCEKIEKASPMDVSYAGVKDARRKLASYQKRLDEVLLEEREVGVKISRARRKEGEAETLWVRRFTS